MGRHTVCLRSLVSLQSGTICLHRCGHVHSFYRYASTDRQRHSAITLSVKGINRNVMLLQQFLPTNCRNATILRVGIRLWTIVIVIPSSVVKTFTGCVR